MVAKLDLEGVSLYGPKVHAWTNRFQKIRVWVSSIKFSHF